MRNRLHLSLLFVASLAACSTAAAAPTLLGPLLSGPEQNTTDAEADGGDDVTPETPATPADAIKAQRAEVAEKLRVAQRVVEQEQPTASGKADKPNLGVELLERRDVLLAQQESAAKQAEELEKTLADLASQLQTVQTVGPDEPQPYTFSLLEKLSDTLDVERDRGATAEASINTATERLEAARKQLADREQNRRKAKEAATKEEAAGNGGPAMAAFKIAQMESELAQTAVALREVELANARAVVAVGQLRVKLLEEKIRIIRPQVTFTKADQEERQDAVKNRENAIKYKIEISGASIKFAEDRWAAARGELDGMAEPTPEAKAQVDALVAERETLVRKLSGWNKQLEWLALERGAWATRYEINQPSIVRNRRVELLAETELKLDSLKQEHRLLDQQLDDTRKVLTTLQGKAQQEDGPTRVYLNRHIGSIETRLQNGYDQLSALDSVTRLHEKIVKRLKQDLGGFSVAEALATGWGWTRAVWDKEIASSGDSRVTVGKVVLGVLLAGMGLLVSRRTSRALGQGVLPRFGVEAGPAAALQTLSFYALMLVSMLMALRLVNVPLGIFTFLGGAVAIGVGFGSQNIINNFISGLILLAERPVRVGDIIEFGQLAGIVKAIGMRSTRIVTGSNLEIIVPNSSLLENNVVNWTLADQTVRCTVPVGVAYGSPTRDVAKWLKHAAENHGLILKKPEPFVWFTGFGDSSLDFELHFFIAMRTLAERRTIESDIRHMVDGLLRDAGIVIAFPQRDLHVDMTGPISVKMEEAAPLQSQPPQQQNAAA